MDAGADAVVPPRSVREFADLDPQWFANALAGEPRQAAALIRASAQLGVPEAQALFGQLLLDGHGVDRNPALARQWFQRAAHAGHAMAMNMLGRCHELGWGGPPDLLVAAYWYQQAAERGLDWGMYNYANLLAQEGSVLCNREAALRWYRQAMALGHAKSINLVGRFYEEGWVVARDLDIAFDHFRRAAIAGDFRGQHNYGRMLVDRGRIDEGAEWLRRALDTATPGFLHKMGKALLDSPHAALRAVAVMALRRCGLSAAV